MGQRWYICTYFALIKQLFTEETTDLSGIWTRISAANHYTTTMVMIV